jgi:hypothetical protein
MRLAIYQAVHGAGCDGEPGHLPRHPQQRVHENPHQRLPAQPRHCRHRHPCH